jgi:hypothetical protein
MAFARIDLDPAQEPLVTGWLSDAIQREPGTLVMKVPFAESGLQLLK